MIVTEGSVITFLQKIKDLNDNELVCYKRKLRFQPGTMHPKLYAAINGQQLEQIIKVVIPKAERGTYNLDNLVCIPKHALQLNTALKKGMLVKSYHNNQPVLAHIHKFDSNTVTLDLNSHLSIFGKDILHEVTILEIEQDKNEFLTESRELIVNEKHKIFLY